MKVEVSFTISLKRSSLHCKISSVTIYGNVRKFSYLGGVHLVDGDDELPDTEGEGEESVLASLTVLGDTSFEFTSTTSNDENGAISLGGTSNHVLDEITVSGSIDDLYWMVNIEEGIAELINLR